MGTITVPWILYAFPWLFFGIVIYFAAKEIAMRIRWRRRTFNRVDGVIIDTDDDAIAKHYDETLRL